MGIQFDKSEPAFTWGGELFATPYVRGSEACNSGPRFGIGPLFQFAVRGLSDPRITLAAHGGGELKREAVPSPRLEGELGGTFFLERPRVALHTGLLFEFAPLFNLAVRHEVFQNVTSATAGFRYFPTYGEATYCIE